MNILNYYQKFIKKSRTFFAGHKQFDVFLFGAAVAVLVLIASFQIYGKLKEPKRIDISISPQSIAIFGSNTMNALIQEFEEQNPDLRIQTAAQESSAVNGGADIIFFDDGEFNRLIVEAALASLAPYHYAETQPEAPVYAALPLVSFMDIFVYNVDILEAAKLDRPPRTRAEFFAAAKAVADAASQKDGQNQVSAFALGLSQADPMALRRDFYPWFWAGGGDLSSIDFSSEEARLPRVFTDTIAFLGQLNREGLLAPDTFEKTRNQRLQEFTEGTIAMILASAHDISFLKNNANGITFGITAVPAAVLGKNRLGLSGIYAGISSNCTLPDEAWRFLAFIAEKKHILAEALNAVPGLLDGSFPGEYIEQDPLYSKAWDIFGAAEIVDYHPGSQNEDEINNLIREKLAEAFK